MAQSSAHVASDKACKRQRHDPSEASPVTLWHGVVWHGRLGSVRPGSAVQARYGSPDPFCRARRGLARSGLARLGEQGEVNRQRPEAYGFGLLLLGRIFRNGVEQAVLGCA